MGRCTAVIFKPWLRYNFSCGAYNTIFCAESAPTSFFCCAWACCCFGPSTLSCAAARVRCKTTAAFLPEKSETAYLETFHTNHQVLSLVTGPFAAHVPMLIHHPQLKHPKGMFTSWDIFPASLNTWFIACRAPSVHR